jgi:hypothetical protein
VPTLRTTGAVIHADRLGLEPSGLRSPKREPQFKTMPPDGGEAIGTLVVDQAWPVYNAHQEVPKR